MKSTNIVYWVTTGLIVAFESLVPALTFNTPLAKEGIAHLGYPDYFRVTFTIFKVLGGILLIFPRIPRRWKEWAYAGFTFDFLFASISHGAVDGVADFQTWFPLIVLAILATSYITLSRRSAGRSSTFDTSSGRPIFSE